MMTQLWRVSGKIHKIHFLHFYDQLWVPHEPEGRRFPELDRQCLEPEPWTFWHSDADANMRTGGESAQSDGLTAGDDIHEFRSWRSLKCKGCTTSIGAKRKCTICIPMVHHPWHSGFGRMKAKEPIQPKAGSFGRENPCPLGSIEGSGQIVSPREGEDVARCRGDAEQCTAPIASRHGPGRCIPSHRAWRNHAAAPGIPSTPDPCRGAVSLPAPAHGFCGSDP